MARALNKKRRTRGLPALRGAAGAVVPSTRARSLPAAGGTVRVTESQRAPSPSRRAPQPPRRCGPGGGAPARSPGRAQVRVRGGASLPARKADDWRCGRRSSRAVRRRRVRVGGVARMVARWPWVH